MQVVGTSGAGYYTPYGDSAPLLAEVGLVDGQAVFEHPQIRVWRKLKDRENATLDATLADGRSIRLHIKRYPATRSRQTPAETEATAARLLEQANIPTIPLLAVGRMPDGRSFLITEDLSGYEPADKLVGAGLPFDRILEPTAALAARLHDANLHHRDLYLCHFFLRLDAGQVTDVHLIDVARVRPLRWLKQRWIVKDLAQYWYSTQSLRITDQQRQAWLDHYGQQRGLSARAVSGLRRAIERKSRAIARHDERLRVRQPHRNISISH